MSGKYRRCSVAVLAAVMTLAAGTGAGEPPPDLSPATAAGTAWVENGAVRAMVVTADDPFPIAAYAAGELAHHVELATGITLPVVTESALPAGYPARIFVGQSDAARAQGIHHDRLASEHCVIRTVGDDLYIVGNDGPGHALDFNNTHAGTLWGVYEVLERELGARWLWPGALGTHVPPTARLAVGRWDETIGPALVRRHIRPQATFRGEGERPDTFRYSLSGRLAAAGRQGIAYSSPAALDRYVWDQAIFMRRHRIGRSADPRPYTGHSFRHWWAEYGREHPEWFQRLPAGELAARWRERFGAVSGAGPVPAGGWPDGHRGSAYLPEREHFTSMCVSNPALHREIIDRWQLRRAERPGETVIISIGENDIRALCTCGPCRAWDAPQPTPGELAAMPGYTRGPHVPHDAGRRYAMFWKRVHEKARAIDPEAIVTAFVYLNYFVAPVDVTLHPNIVLSFCPFGGWWFPRDPREQAWLREQWRRWRATGATLYYRPNYLSGLGSLPHVIARQMFEELQYFYRHGAIGTDFDRLGGQWAVNGPTMYLLHRFHVRPGAPADQLLDEYAAAFGPAALPVRAYFDFWEAHTTANRALHGLGGLNHLYNRDAHRRYPAESFARAAAILDAAAAAVADEPDDVYARRVEYLRLGLVHARKIRGLAALFAEGAPPERLRAAADALLAFRHQTEHLHLANLAKAGYLDHRAWGDRFLPPGE